MQPQPTMRCGECRQPILSGEQCVCFKVPGTAGASSFTVVIVEQTAGKEF
jgi:hypothetical protein